MLCALDSRGRGRGGLSTGSSRLLVSPPNAGTHARHHVKVVCCRRAFHGGGLSPRSAGVAPAPPLRAPGVLNANNATPRPAPAQSRAVDAQTGHAQRADDGPRRRRAADYRGVPRTMGAWVSGRAADYNADGATAQGLPGAGVG